MTKSDRFITIIYFAVTALCVLFSFTFIAIKDKFIACSLFGAYLFLWYEYTNFIKWRKCILREDYNKLLQDYTNLLKKIGETK